MPGINEYWESLERLKKNKPIRLPMGTPINKDSVALEAGRKRGSIKKSRKNFAELIEAIDLSAEESVSQEVSLKTRLANEKSQKANYRDLYHQSLNRELMLVEQLSVLEKELKKYDNVVPILK